VKRRILMAKIIAFFVHLWMLLSAFIGNYPAPVIAIYSAIILAASFVVIQVISYIMERKTS
jgi:hypothetical protein